MPVAFDFALEPKAAMDYLNGKGYQISYDYDELAGRAHHQAFTAAKVMRADLLQDLHSALLSAQRAGTPFKSFLENLKPTLKSKGWWGEQDIINPKTGEVKTVQINGHRLQNIFNTNKRVAYSVARHKKQRKGTTEYWSYTSLLLPTSRDSHTALHGTVLHRGNDFWLTNYPPNGWGCKCKVRAYTKGQLDKRGTKIAQQAPDSIASKDWAYDIGAGNRVSRISKLNLAAVSLAQIAAKPELDKLTDEQLKTRFYNTLGVKEGELYIDAIGDPMTVGDELFTSANGHSKLKKRNRHLYVDELAETIAEPDEIYLETETLGNGQTRIVKKLLRYFDESNKTKAVQAVFSYEKDKTQGVSIHVIDTKNSVESRRKDRLVYKKDSDS